MLLYKLTEEEILEIIAMFAHQRLSDGLDGVFDIQYNEEGEIEVHFFKKESDLLN